MASPAEAISLAFREQLLGRLGTASTSSNMADSAFGDEEAEEKLPARKMPLKEEEDSQWRKEEGGSRWEEENR